MAKKAKKQKKDSGSTIVLNRSARHEFFVEEKYEAGIALEGWEVKALREGRVNIKDSYVHLKNGEAWLLACTINPLSTASTHITPEPMRSRKLLLNRAEIDKLEKTESEGRLYTEYSEWYQVPMFIGLGLILLQIVLVSTRFRSLP